MQEVDADWMPGLGRSPGGVNGNPLQYSFLENLMDRQSGRLHCHRLTKSMDMTEAT